MSREAALKTLYADMRDRIAQYSWTSHLIVDAPVPSIHTHGLDETAHHPDLEVVLPTDPDTLYRLLAPLAEAAAAGTRFSIHTETVGLFKTPVRFRDAVESGRPVLRAIFPDPCGRWPEDPLVAAGYELQLEGLDA
jgi:hypothetical protein